MPIFVVSLFLPYTVDFHDLSSPDRAHATQLRGSTASNPDLNGTASLFPVPTPPRTPAENLDIFSKLQLEHTPDSYFPNTRDPRSLLVRSDNHLPEWGTGQTFFNQPRSRADPAPPATILKYAQAQDRVEQNTRSSRLPRKGSRTSPEHGGGGGKHFASNEWTIEPAVQGNGGLANAIRAARAEGNLGEIIWVGFLGFPTDTLDEARKDEIHEKLESEYDALTVYVSDSDFDGHYAHYCKTILWPVFHYQIPDHPKSKAYEDHSWVYYVNLNQAVADKVTKSYKRGDIIWVHDYHLLLVPAMIRKKLPDAQIGFFLHTAFPSSEVFRCLSVRKELLEGMLGANLVAFQTREYAQHFLQTCSRLLIVEATNDGVQLESRFVNVNWLPMGIDPKGLALAREERGVLDWIKTIEERYSGKRLIVARDKLDNVRGVRQKLLAFELFLNKKPEWRDKVVLIQVATPTPEHSELAATVSDIVTRIDSMHSTLAHQPLIFLRQDIAFSQYLALLSAADVLLITSLREGMNLTAHEYIFCQDGKLSSKKHGPLILSEFTGSASVFGDSELAVNPWDHQQVANAIETALVMDDSEKAWRYEKLRQVVMNQTGGHWCKTLQDTLAKVHEEHFMRDTMSIPRLSIAQLSERYKAANKRLFILDYEGTMASYGSPTSIILTSPQRVLDALNDILLDERNFVYVMSGRTPEELERLFSRVPGVGIIAENGCFLREYDSDEWIAFADTDETAKWKSAVSNILQYYVERLEGAWVEQRHCSLILHYEKAEDLEAATRQAGDCANHINDACESQRVHAVPVDRAVLIEPLDWSKASAAATIFDGLKRDDGPPDFLVVAGDDREDEVIFRWANKLSHDGLVRDVTTVSVGKRNTEAMATLTQGTTGLLSVLQKLAKLS